MKCIKSLSASLALAGLTSTALTGPGFAFEADAVAKRFEEIIEKQQVDVEWSAVRKDGTSVVLEDVTAMAEGEDDKLELGDLVLQDVSEDEMSYRIGTVVIDEYAVADDDVSVAIKGLSIAGLVLPKQDETDPYGGVMRYERMEVASVSVKDEDGSLVDARNAVVSMDADGEDSLSFSGSVESFTANLDNLMESGNAMAAVKQLGYSTISGSAEMEGAWRASDGLASLDTYKVTVENAGTFTLSGEISGYTPEFVKALTEMTSKMQSGGENPMQGMAMLGLMQQLNFHGLSLRFEDASLTGKLLEFVASKQGGKPADVVKQAEAIIPLQVSPYLGPDMTRELTEAVTTFLNDPQNITIAAQPESPAPFTMIMGAAMGSPELLVKQIGLSAKANQ
ncbi:hypothetical protein [Nitratireductor basaltis]|uniref:Transmembrane protein n=1 Tax=Nitratireductor basaltis TaxID=472175 RepID=A0A084UBY4_9HYPH|nr:hypothetical protein [Nitratireductor basaltis]KFB10470.1 hypothetical protein EL18_01505 [Nitratireductor basaltis]